MKKKKMTAAEKNRALWGWMFITPTMLGLIILNFYPIFNTAYQSLCKTGDFGKGNTFVGLRNFQSVLSNPETWQSLINTIKYALIEVPFGVVIALILAVFLNKKLKGKKTYYYKVRAYKKENGKKVYSKYSAVKKIKTKK